MASSSVQGQCRGISNNKNKSVFGSTSLWITLFVVVLGCDKVMSNTDYCDGKFDRCICTDGTVECHNENLSSITKLYTYIKDHVVNVTITGSNFKELPENVLGSCKSDTSLRLDELLRLDLSNNSIERIHGKTFHCMRNLTELNLSENNWRNDLHVKQIGYFTSMPKLRHLDLTNAFEEVFNGSIHITKLSSVFNQTNMSLLETLKLGHNELYSFSESAANTMCRLVNLRMLDLSNNNLESPSLPTVTDCLEKLETLDLSNNTMERLPNEFIAKVSNLKDLKTVRLVGNPFNCDCGLLDTWHWLNASTIVKDKMKILCKDGYHSSYIGKPVLSIMPLELQCIKPEPPSSTAARVVTGVIFAVIALTLVAFLIVNREKVRLAYKRMSKRIPKVNFRSRTGYKSVQEVAFVENV